jgi:hypothetical protein
LQIAAIQFAKVRGAARDFHSLYLNGNSHPQMPGVSLDWWGRGAKVDTPEWDAALPDHVDQRACFTRNGPVSMSLKLVARTSAALSGTIRVTPKLDGSRSPLQQASENFTYPANASELWVDISLGGVLPDEVGRYVLSLQWRVEGPHLRFAGPQTTHHKIYGIYGRPFDPGYDSPSANDAGRQVAPDEGTLTGTRKRLDHLTALLGGTSRRHAAASQADLVALVWRLHVGINDTPGAPPYFNAEHSEHIDDPSGTYLPLEDQWLAWVTTAAPHWNSASCIGHVQLAKTMLASVGLFARRTWVFPTTKRLPDGTILSLQDLDCYCLGTYDSTKQQSQALKDPAGNTYTAHPKLLEPGDSWENFEACMLSPPGRFLPGGYETRTLPPLVRSAKGFGSAKELLRWWSNTSRPVFGKRFMAWVAQDALGNTHYWDVEGTHYDFAHVRQIRDRHKELPPP